MKSVVHQLGLGPFTIGNVLNLKNEAQQFSLWITNPRNAQKRPDLMTRPMDIPLLCLITSSLAIHQPRLLHQEIAEILRVS